MNTIPEGWEIADRGSVLTLKAPNGFTWSFLRSEPDPYEERMGSFTHEFLRAMLNAAPQPPVQHDLYKTGDKDAPESIKDRNGEVALGLCRTCGRGECELAEPCKTPVQEVSCKSCKNNGGTRGVCQNETCGYEARVQDTSAKDAARYRWLRSNERGMANLSHVINDDLQPLYYELKCGGELDAAIDAALKGQS